MIDAAKMLSETSPTLRKALLINIKQIAMNQIKQDDHSSELLVDYFFCRVW